MGEKGAEVMWRGRTYVAGECQPDSHQTNCEHLLAQDVEYQRQVRIEQKVDAISGALLELSKALIARGSL